MKFITDEQALNKRRGMELSTVILLSLVLIICVTASRIPTGAEERIDSIGLLLMQVRVTDKVLDDLGLEHQNAEQASADDRSRSEQ